LGELQVYNDSTRHEPDSGATTGPDAGPNTGGPNTVPAGGPNTGPGYTVNQNLAANESYRDKSVCPACTEIVSCDITT